jgi:hypothetical protein
VAVGALATTRESFVAGGRVVGAAFRVAPPGEWRTNIALGGVRREVSEPRRDAAALALEAARAIGTSLVGVDLLPDSRGGWIVAELDGAVEFTRDYASGTTSSWRLRPPSRARAANGAGTLLSSRLPGSPEWSRGPFCALLHSCPRGGVAQLVRAAES